MPTPARHFSDLPAALEITAHDDVLRVDGAGFITRPMTEVALAPYGGGRGLAPRLLVDLLDVSGYEAECVGLAQEWLRQARALGVERIAFVANSSVVRTATDVVARHLRAPLRTFENVGDARAWLGQTERSCEAPESGHPRVCTGSHQAVRPRA